MKINTINYLIHDAFKSLKRNKTISLASVITVLITSFVLGVFVLVAQNANQMIAGLEDKIEIQVYLKNDIKLIDQREIQVKLKEQDGVESIEYESAEDAYNKVLKSNPEFLKGYTLEKNPFPASYIVKLSDADKIDSVSKSIDKMTGVESVESQKSIVSTMQKVINVVKTVGGVIAIVLIAVSIFLIMNTTKLTVFSRRKEVGIMKFVGATDWFIRWPFIIEGMVIGLVGALIASLLLYIGYSFALKGIESAFLMMSFSFISPSYILTTIIFIFIGGGMLIGGIASYFALRNHLKV